MDNLNEPNFEFYVLNYDFNSKNIINFNVFDNCHVYDSALKLTKKHLRNKKKFTYEEYKKELLSTIMWQEWGRREYEISVGDAFETNLDKFKKIDCYEQAKPNIDVIAQMCIKRYKDYIKIKK